MQPLLVTIPHSGETIPEEAGWLKGLPEATLMCDVDRYINRLYEPTLNRLKIPHVICPWHRYVVDLNRLADDVDEDSVQGHKNPSGSFTTGLHWVKTTTGIVLMKKPITPALHEVIVKKYFQPFHQETEAVYGTLRAQGADEVFHLDLHSMPSWGTAAHRDPGQRRAEIVISDFNGTSSRAEFKDLVMKAYEKAGFQIAYNWPYVGGRMTQVYGQPQKRQHAIQVELRRDLYMNEESKQIFPDLRDLTQRLSDALTTIHDKVRSL